MRTDCTIDNRQIKCPHLTPVGFDKWKAKRGDLIRYRAYNGIHLARVLGRVTAPSLGKYGTENYSPPVTGWALVMSLADDGHTVYERWVKPEDIVQIRDPAPKMAAFFHGPLPRDVNMLRRLMSDGWLSEGGLDNAPLLKEAVEKVRK